MALTKTKVDLIGTAASKQAFSAAQAITSGNRATSGVLGIMITIAVVYGSSVPTSSPLVSVYTSPDGSNFDNQPYESFYIPTTTEAGSSAASTTQQLSFPVRFAEDVAGYNIKLTNGSTNGISAWVAAVEVAP